MTYTEADINAIVSKMKHYYKNIYKLVPAELADFMKIRSNFIRIGIPLSEETLSRPEEEVVAYIKEKIKFTHHSTDTVMPNSILSAPALKDTLHANVALINEDRTEIRKHLFNENIIIELERVGRVFASSWNSKMTVCKISIPSTWQIKAPQSLLLDINEKDKKMFDDLGTHTNAKHPGLSKLGAFIYELLMRHSDYAVIKKIVEIEFENPANIFSKNADKRKMTKLTSKGLSAPVSALLIALAEQIEAKTFSTHTINNILGYRKRLLNEFTDLVQ